MEHYKEEFEKPKRNVFEFKGKSYRIAHEDGIVIAIEKDKLPQTLARVIPDSPLFFDENDILMPAGKVENRNNEMVSLARIDEWEKFARMFCLDKSFKVISVETGKLIGPTFFAGNRILKNGEILALVPKDAIVEEKRFDWAQAEDDYDYGVDDYADDYDRDFYQRLVVNRSKGLKPKEIQ